MTVNIKQILKLYGRWGNGRLGTEYRSTALGINGAEPATDYAVLELREQSALLVEKVVLSLREVNFRHFEMIVLQYVDRIDESVMLDYFNMSKTTFYRELAKAEAYILGGIVNSPVEVVFYA